MKKLIALIFVALPLMAFSPASADVQGKNPKLILDNLSAQQASDLNIVVPRDTEPGYQILTIQVYDDSGVLSERFVYFCKDVDGEVHWDNKCPDISPTATKAELHAIEARVKLPKYLAAMESKKHSRNFLVAVGLLLLTANIRTHYKDAANAALESLDVEVKEKGEDVRHWGDRSFTWKFFFRKQVDKFFTLWPEAISRRSLLFARIVGDGDYARAMFGSLSTFSYFGAIAVGWYGAKSVQFQALPPQVLWITILIALGIFDSLSGFVGALVYAVSVAVTGHIHSLSEGLTVFAVATLFFSPVLVAAATRKFRRKTTNSPERWEKLTDYALAPVIGGWVVNKIIEGLNAVAHLQLEITFYARALGVFACALLLIRMFVEEFAHRVYTWRLRKVSVEYQEQSKSWQIFLAFGRLAMMLFLAAQFVGLNRFLAAGLALSIIPRLLKILAGEKVRRFVLVHHVLPRGIFLSVVLVYFGALYQIYLRSQFANPSDYLKWSFFLAGVPAFAISVLNLFAKPPVFHRWSHGAVSRYPWRIASIFVYAAFIFVVLGIDIPTFYHQHLQTIDWSHVGHWFKDRLFLN